MRVLVPGRSDVGAVYYAGRRLYGRLFRHGVRIWEWHKSVLHSKCAVIDDQWSTVGTYNLDYRSWYFNLEVNVAVESEQVAQSMRSRFELDISESSELDRRRWDFRPLMDRFFEYFYYMFRKLL